MLMTASAVGFESRVNSFTPGAQDNSDVAINSAGDYVVVWQSDAQDTSDFGIYAQRFNSQGIAQGHEFRVNSYSTGAQTSPSVAMDVNGDFIVTWVSTGQDGSGGGIYGRRYNQDGVSQGTEFRVNTYTIGSQTSPDVAMDATGEFAVVWQSNGQDGDTYGIYGQRFDAAGTAQGPEFRVNSYLTGSQSSPSIAMNGPGRFVVSWSSLGQDGSNDGIYAQRYNSAGVAQGAEFRANTFTTGIQDLSAVAMDAGGDFTIVWNSNNQDGNGYGIYGQRFGAPGLPNGSEFRVNTTTTGNQHTPAIAMDGGGDFAVSWQSNNQDGSQYGVYAQRYTSVGTKDWTEYRVNTFTSLNQTSPAIAMNANGDYVTTWQSNANQDGSGYGVYAQRYVNSVGPLVTAVLNGNRVIEDGDRIPHDMSEITVQFSQDMNDSLGGGSVTNPTSWHILRNGIDLLNPIYDIDYGYNSQTNRYEAKLIFQFFGIEGTYQLIANSSIHSKTTDLPLDGDADGIEGGDFQRTFYVAAPIRTGVQGIVNTFTTQAQSTPAIATDATGDYVVAWSSLGQDGDQYGVYAQRFNVKGTPQGSEFRVNTYTTGNQSAPSIAMDPAGDFVITWVSGGNQDGNSLGIFAQRYNSVGVAQGSEFRVNNYTTGTQTSPAAAMDDQGDFVITWRSFNQEGPASGYGIYAQQFNAAGVSKGIQIHVNSYTTGNQSDPSVAMDKDGDFVIAWSSANQEAPGSQEGIYAQRFNPLGVPQGSEFRINQYTTGAQTVPSVAMDSMGDFVVAWSSANQAGPTSKEDIYARGFDAAGFPREDEFRVNGFTTNSQYAPKVGMDPFGDYVVTWQSYGFDGDHNGIVARAFTPDDGALSRDEFRINSFSTSNQQFPAVTRDAAGDFFIAWQSLGQDGSNLGIVAQGFQTDVAPSIYGLEYTPLNAVASLNTPIAPTLLANDPDSVNWTGASVQITTNYMFNQDVLLFTNQLGISGSWNQFTGTLTLTGVSSVANYQTALRSVTYHNTSATPNTSKTRTVIFLAKDGLLTSAFTTNESTRTAIFVGSDGLLTGEGRRDLKVSLTSAPPVVTGVPATASYTENAVHMPIAPNAVLSDPDSYNLEGMTISFTNWQGEDRLDFLNLFGLTHSFTQDLVAHTASLTISGTETIAHYQTTLQNVVYWSVSDAPSAAVRVASITLTDGAATSNAATSNISVTVVNDAPLLSAIEASPLMYKANDGAFPPLNISSTLLVADADSTMLSGATVKISAGYQNDASGHDVLAFVNQLGITGAFDAATGTLTLSGLSSVSNYRTALRSVVFSSSGSAVSTATRKLTITATDNFSPAATSLAITRDVTVSTNNIPSTVYGIPGTALSYTKGSSAIQIASGLSLFDPDSINLTGAAIQISKNYQNGQDVLAATTDFGITASFNAATGTLTLSGTASLANYETVLRSVTYKTNTAAALANARTVTWVVNDGLSLSNPASRTINVS